MRGISIDSFFIPFIPPATLKVAGGFLDSKKKFHTGVLTMEKTGGDTPIDVAKEVTSQLPLEDCTFSMIHKKWLSNYVIGFISNEKQYGIFFIANYATANFSVVRLDKGKYSL